MKKCNGCSMDFESETSYDLHFPIFHEGDDWDKIKEISEESKDDMEDETMFKEIKERLMGKKVEITKDIKTESEKFWKHKLIIDLHCEDLLLINEITTKVMNVVKENGELIDVRNYQVKKVEVFNGREVGDD